MRKTKILRKFYEFISKVCGGCVSNAHHHFTGRVVRAIFGWLFSLGKAMVYDWILLGLDCAFHVCAHQKPSQINRDISVNCFVIK